MAGKFTLATVFEAVDHMSGPAKTMEKNVGHMADKKRSFSGLKGIIAGAIGGLTVAGALHEITEFAEKGDEISRTSRALGMSAEALQKLRYAAHLADVPAETLTGALKKMNLNLGQLATRQGALYTHLSRTNPALARQLYATKDSNKAFLLLMDAINHTSNAQERAALTVAAFGKSGQEMLPLIMEGSGIADMGEEAQKSRPCHVRQHGEGGGEVQRQSQAHQGGRAGPALPGAREDPRKDGAPHRALRRMGYKK